MRGCWEGVKEFCVDVWEGVKELEQPQVMEHAEGRKRAENAPNKLRDDVSGVVEDEVLVGVLDTFPGLTLPTGTPLR